MIQLTKNSNAILFTFDENDHYLYNGTIEVPVNSLSLVTDSSEMFTFKKSATNDIFVSGLYSEIGMTKSELETFYKENMVGSTGGITSGEVQSMIDESISGKADTSAVTESINAAVSGKADSDSVYLKTETSGATQISTAISKLATNEALLNVYERLDGSISVIEESISGKADTSAVTESINAAVSGKVDTSAVTSSVTSASTDSQIPTAKAVYDAIPTGGTGGGKAISAGTNISVTTGETADTINCTLPISADSKGIYTTSTYPFLSTSNKSGNVVFGDNNTLDTFGSSYYSKNNLFFGSDNNIKTNGSGMLIGGMNNQNNGNNSNTTACVALGSSNKVGNPYEFASGLYNLTHYSAAVFGTSGNTLFSVGNGDSFGRGRHNALEIRQNGDIYIVDTNDTSTANFYEKPMIKLQDQLGGGGGGITSGEVQSMIDESISGKVDTSSVTTAVTSGSTDVITSGGVYDQLGGLKLQQISQVAYDTLVSGGTVDSSTVYIIVN